MRAHAYRDETTRVFLILAISAAYLLLTVISSEVASAPFRPASDAHVLEQVSPRDDPETAKLRGLSLSLPPTPRI